jgi:hypothetical protein
VRRHLGAFVAVRRYLYSLAGVVLRHSASS